jgi:predicted GTPase
VYMTEIKAAAIDVVVEEANRRGVPVVFVDNEPREAAPARDGALAETCHRLADLAKERFALYAGA